MQNMTRFAILLTTSLLVVPAASAQGLLELDATADVQAKADASGAFRAVDAAKSHVDSTRAELEAKANEIRADAEYKAEAALEQTEAQAQASAEASLSFGEQVAAKVQEAIETVKEFAAKISASASADVDAGIEG